MSRFTDTVVEWSYIKDVLLPIIHTIREEETHMLRCFNVLTHHES